MAHWPDTTLDAMLDGGVVTGTVYYLTFNTADPGTTDATEWTGARQAITFVAGAVHVKASGGTDAAQTFASIPAEAGGLPYFTVMTAVTAGAVVFSGTTTGLSGSLPAGATITVASGATTATATG